MSSIWEVKRLGDICEVGAGNPAPQKEEFFIDGDYPFFRTSDVGVVHIGSLTESSDFLNEQGIKKMKLFKKGTILVPKSGASTFLNHRVIMGVDGYVSSHLATIKTDGSILDENYLFYFLQEVKAQDLIQDHKYPSLNLSVISSIQISFPKLISEQRRIVKKLDKVFENVAEAKEAAERNLANSKELFDSYLQTVFADPIWEKKELGKVAMHSLGKMLDKSKNKGEPKPYLRNLNVRWFEFDLSDIQEMRFEAKESDKYMARKGDVMICEGGYPGRAAMWMNDEDIYFQKAIHRVRFPSITEGQWFLYFLYLSHKSGALANYLTGTGILHFTGEALDSFIFPVPPISDQKIIVKKLDSLFEQTKELERVYEQKLLDMEELKKSVLAKAFTGGL